VFRKKTINKNHLKKKNIIVSIFVPFYVSVFFVDILWLQKIKIESFLKKLFAENTKNLCNSIKLKK
jgi:hypothetical protein